MSKQLSFKAWCVVVVGSALFIIGCFGLGAWFLQSNVVWTVKWASIGAFIAIPLLCLFGWWGISHKKFA